MRSLVVVLLIFAGVATAVVLFPGPAWFSWVVWIGGGFFLGGLAAVLLVLVFRGVRWLVKSVGRPAPAESDSGEQAVGPKGDV
jgi:hypothetical protein